MPRKPPPVPRGIHRPGKEITYARCGTCGDDFDIEMMRPLGRSLICLLCLNLARERQKRDTQMRLKRRVKDAANTEHRETDPCGAVSAE